MKVRLIDIQRVTDVDLTVGGPSCDSESYRRRGDSGETHDLLTYDPSCRLSHSFWSRLGLPPSPEDTVCEPGIKIVIDPLCVTIPKLCINSQFSVRSPNALSNIPMLSPIYLNLSGFQGKTKKKMFFIMHVIIQYVYVPRIRCYKGQSSLG